MSAAQQDLKIGGPRAAVRDAGSDEVVELCNRSGGRDWTEWCQKSRDPTPADVTGQSKPAVQIDGYRTATPMALRPKNVEGSAINPGNLHSWCFLRHCAGCCRKGQYCKQQGLLDHRIFPGERPSHSRMCVLPDQKKKSASIAFPPQTHGDAEQRRVASVRPDSTASQFPIVVESRFVEGKAHICTNMRTRVARANWGNWGTLTRFG